MCMTTVDTFTMAAMLADPLTQMVMRSDGVSEQDFSELLQRIQRQLAARAAQPVCRSTTQPCA